MNDDDVYWRADAAVSFKTDTRQHWLRTRIHVISRVTDSFTVFMGVEDHLHHNLLGGIFSS